MHGMALRERTLGQACLGEQCSLENAQDIPLKVPAPIA